MHLSDGKYEALVAIGDQNRICKISVDDGVITNWHTDAEYSPEQVIRLVSSKDKCPDCKGTGDGTWFDGINFYPETCSTCKGTGEKPKENPNGSSQGQEENQKDKN